jgi:hypothetical protein
VPADSQHPEEAAGLGRGDEAVQHREPHGLIDAEARRGQGEAPERHPQAECIGLHERPEGEQRQGREHGEHLSADQDAPLRMTPDPLQRRKLEKDHRKEQEALAPDQRLARAEGDQREGRQVPVHAEVVDLPDGVARDREPPSLATQPGGERRRERPERVCAHGRGAAGDDA